MTNNKAADHKFKVFKAEISLLAQYEWVWECTPDEIKKLDIKKENSQNYRDMTSFFYTNFSRRRDISVRKAIEQHKYRALLAKNENHSNALKANCNPLFAKVNGVKYDASKDKNPS